MFSAAVLLSHSHPFSLCLSFVNSLSLIKQLNSGVLKQRDHSSNIKYLLLPHCKPRATCTLHILTGFDRILLSTTYRGNTDRLTVLNTILIHQDIDNQLRTAAEAFLENDDGCVVDSGKREVRLSQIFKWYKADFGGTDEKVVLTFYV